MSQECSGPEAGWNAFILDFSTDGQNGSIKTASNTQIANDDQKTKKKTEKKLMENAFFVRLPSKNV